MKAQFRTLAVLAIVASVLILPVLSEASDASAYQICEGLNISVFDETTEMKSGGDSSIDISLRNDSDGDITVHLNYSNSSGSPVKVSFDGNDFTLSKGKSKIVTVSFFCDRNTEQGTHTTDILFTVYNYSTAKEGHASVTVTEKVSSQYASDGAYNKIMGKFENTLPEPFNGPVTSAIITALIWAVIAALVYFVIHVVSGHFLKTDESDRRRELRRRCGSIAVLIVMINGIIQAVEVYGVNENIIRIASEVASIIVVPMVAYAVWDIYKIAVTHIFQKMEKDGKVMYADTSLIPFFNTIGKIIIAVVAFAVIMSMFGVDVVAIIAGAGIITLAISIGAQSIIAQFLSGMMLLITRPFKVGDIVKINNSSDIYEVIRIGFMCTTFKNWHNLEVVTMSNNTFDSAMITNITAETSAYRLYLYYGVDFNSDFDLVRRTLIDTASRHPKAIIDGSYAKPDVRVNEFLSTAVQIRLAVYIRDFRDNIEVSDELYASGINDLKAAGVNLPFELRDVRIVLPEDDTDD